MKATQRAAKKTPAAKMAAPGPQWKLLQTCTKMFPNYPFAHRQHMHDGHCALIHGHNWGFEFTFDCDRLDENKFVIDFGKLQWLKKWLADHFDHTLVLNADDPHLATLRECLEVSGPNPVTFAKIVVVPNGGAEGLAAWTLNQVNLLLGELAIGQDRGLFVRKVVVFEDDKNSATAEILRS